MRKLIHTATTLAIVSGSQAQATQQDTNWEQVGLTAASCEFQGRFDVIPGYPFARFVWSHHSEEKIVPLVVNDGERCDWVQYHQVSTPLQLQVPTFEAFGQFLCMGRLPEFTVTMSLSGVQHSCTLSPTM